MNRTRAVSGVAVVRDHTARKALNWAERLMPGLAPEQSASGARIHVNSSGTTSVDPSALSEIARRRFSELQPRPDEDDEQAD
jgi:hypothetical protein